MKPAFIVAAYLTVDAALGLTIWKYITSPILAALHAALGGH